MKLLSHYPLLLKYTLAVTDEALRTQLIERFFAGFFFRVGLDGKLEMVGRLRGNLNETKGKILEAGKAVPIRSVSLINDRLQVVFFDQNLPSL